MVCYLSYLFLLHHICSSFLAHKHAIGLPQDKQRYPNPQSVEEEEVHPQVHEVRSIKAWAARQPLRGECHETCIRQNHIEKTCNNAMHLPPYNSPIATTVAHHQAALTRPRTRLQQTKHANGAMQPTVANSMLTNVRSAPPHRLSARAYSCHNCAVTPVP